MATGSNSMEKSSTLYECKVWYKDLEDMSKGPKSNLYVAIWLIHGATYLLCRSSGYVSILILIRALSSSLRCEDCAWPSKAAISLCVFNRVSSMQRGGEQPLKPPLPFSMCLSPGSGTPMMPHLISQVQPFILPHSHSLPTSFSELP